MLKRVIPHREVLTQGSNPSSTPGQHLRYVPSGYNRTFLVSDVELSQEERETARKSEKESTSPKKDKEPPLELR